MLFAFEAPRVELHLQRYIARRCRIVWILGCRFVIEGSTDRIEHRRFAAAPLTEDADHKCLTLPFRVGIRAFEMFLNSCDGAGDIRGDPIRCQRFCASFGHPSSRYRVLTSAIIYRSEIPAATAHPTNNPEALWRRAVWKIPSRSQPDLS